MASGLTCVRLFCEFLNVNKLVTKVKIGELCWLSSLPTFSMASQNLPPDLSALIQLVRSTAQDREGDCLALLELLRLLDTLHFEIRDTLFREALPDNRQRLYRLLKDIEHEGGWPYIKRMPLRALLAHLEEASDEVAADKLGRRNEGE